MLFASWKSSLTRFSRAAAKPPPRRGYRERAAVAAELLEDRGLLTPTISIVGWYPEVSECDTVAQSRFAFAVPNNWKAI